MHRTAPYLNILIPFCCFIVIAVSVPYLPPGLGYDRECWQNWSLYMFYHGVQNTYEADTDYLPLYQYIMYIYANICGGPRAIHDNISYLRLFTLAFDWLGLWYVYLWTGKKIPYYLLVLVSLVNIAYAYDTLYWGQVDGISSALVFISIYYGYSRRPVTSSAFIILALNMKLQSGIFLPLWGYIYITTALETKRFKHIYLPLLTGAAVQMLILLPFVHKLPVVWHVVEASFGKYPKMSWSASNFWYIVFGFSAATLPDTGIFLFRITYRQVGLILFFVVSAIALLPTLRILIKKLFTQTVSNLSREQVWLIGAIIAIAFFFFPTEMHERYSHHAFLFITAYAVYKKDYFLYLLFSFVFFTNLERVLYWMKLNHRTLIFDHRAIAWGYVLVLLYLFFRLWRTSCKQPSGGP